MLLEDIYAQLKRQHLCSSAYEFSVQYLGKSRSYYSVLKSRNEEPSLEAVVTLETALKDRRDLFSDSHPVFIRTKARLDELRETVGSHREALVRQRLATNEH